MEYEYQQGCRRSDPARISLEGRLDTTTAPQLEAEFKQSLGGITSLELDFGKLGTCLPPDCGSFGHAENDEQTGKMVIRHINGTSMEVFEVTGFIDILTIE